MVLVTTIIVCSAIIVAAIYKRRRKVLTSQDQEEANSVQNLEVKREDVIIGPELGQGNFGTVYKGTLKDYNIKVLSSTISTVY